LEAGGGGVLNLHIPCARIFNFVNYAAPVDEPDGARVFIKARCQVLEKYL
jgi:hypothetical protein